MKKIIASAILMLFVSVNILLAQAPNKINYQGVARDSNGHLIVNRDLGLRLTILGGAMPVPVYIETHTAHTNAYGVYNVAIGGGTVESGSIAGINWGTANAALKVEVDPAGGTAYVDMGTNQLLSVPYALYAANGPSTHVSAFYPAGGCTGLVPTTTTMTKVGDLGSFNTLEVGTFVEVNLQTSLYVSSLGTASAVVFELRVDETATTTGNATAMVFTQATPLPVNIKGVFTGLPLGIHNVSVWAMSINGNASGALYDPGCYNSVGTNNVLVKEYH